MQPQNKFKELDTQVFKIAEGVTVKLKFIGNKELKGYQFIGFMDINDKQKGFISERFVSEDVYDTHQLALANALKQIVDLKQKHGIKDPE